MTDGGERVPGPPPASDRLLWDTWLSAFQLPALIAADELGLFELLGGRSLPASRISSELGLSARAAEGLLALLSSLGYLEQRAGEFANTDVARAFLVPSSPYYWGGVLDVYRDGTPTPEGLGKALRRDLDDPREPIAWETRSLEPDVARRFTAFMHSHSLAAAMGIAGRGLIRGVKRLLDVGGGSGCFCIALALRDPKLRCTVLELPPVCALVDEYAAQFGVGGRITAHAADMFADAFPEGHDAVLFANIFHDWTPEQCVELGRRAFACLPAGGRVFLHEIVLAEGRDGPPAAAGLSMVMLKAVRGKQYTASELAEMLRAAGFADVTFRDSYGYFTLATARKP